MKEIFDRIYKNKIWACGNVLSGAGSDPNGSRDYIEYLKKFKDKSVLDLGCGDLSLYGNNIFFKSYVGVDIVDIKKYKTINKETIIVTSDILEFDYQNYTFDLILIKDVLQHINNRKICAILDKLSNLNVDIIITNDFNCNSVNLDCEDGEHRFLNMELSPFNLKIKNKYDWHSYIDGRLKQSVLI